MSLTPLKVLRRTIESTLLKVDATKEEIHDLCREAVRRRFYAVCVRPEWAAWAKTCLGRSAVKLVVVVGFHDGSVATDVKIADVQIALAAGADEVDMVVDLTQVKAHNYAAIRKDVEAVVAAANGKPVKVILETHLLDAEELDYTAHIACQAGAKFLKTCTGFTGGGATIEAVRALVRVASSYKDIEVKASGGVRTTEQARAMLAAGATRLGVGTPSGRNIADGAKAIRARRRLPPAQPAQSQPAAY